MPNNIKEDLALFNELITVFLEDERQNPVAEYINPKNVEKAIDIKYPELEVIPSMSSGGTDGMHFRATGIPSYGVNGHYGKTSDSFSHGLNERILVESFYDNVAHWYVLLQAIAGKH